MITIKLEYDDWKTNVDNKSLDHFCYMQNGRYEIIGVDGQIIFAHRLDQDDEMHYMANYMPTSNMKMGNYYSREPFATKVLKDGSKLFRRKHGVKTTIAANAEEDIIFTVPYSQAKINKLEVIDANALDRIDLLVKSPIDVPTATAYGMPADYLLNQFGFDVVVSSLLYSDKSDYDADVYYGMQIIARYKNDTNEAKDVGLNLIYHEVVA